MNDFQNMPEEENQLHALFESLDSVNDNKQSNKQIKPSNQSDEEYQLHSLFDEFDRNLVANIPPRTLGSTLKDAAISVGKGALELPGMATGLAELPIALTTGTRPLDTITNYVGEKTGIQPHKWAENLAENYSPNQKQSEKDISKVWDDPNTTGWDVAKEYATNPGYVVNQILESVPSMAVGGFAGKAVMGAGKVATASLPAVEGIVAREGAGLLEKTLAEKAIAKLGTGASKEAIIAAQQNAYRNAAAIAGGTGEGLIQAGQAMDQYKGDDPRKGALVAGLSGVIDAVIGGVSGKVAQHLGFETAETAMAKGFNNQVENEIKTGLAKYGIPGKMLGGALSEGILQELPQGAQEQIFQNYANGNPLWSGVPRNAVESALAGFAMGAGANLISGTDPEAGKNTQNKLNTEIPKTNQPETTQPDSNKFEVIVNGKRDFETEKQLAKQSADRLASIDEEFKQRFGDVEADKAKLDSGEMSTDDFIKKYELEEIVSALKPETQDQQTTITNTPGWIQKEIPQEDQGLNDYANQRQAAQDYNQKKNAPVIGWAHDSSIDVNNRFIDNEINKQYNTYNPAVPGNEDEAKVDGWIHNSIASGMSKDEIDVAVQKQVSLEYNQRKNAKPEPQRGWLFDNPQDVTNRMVQRRIDELYSAYDPTVPENQKQLVLNETSSFKDEQQVSDPTQVDQASQVPSMPELEAQLTANKQQLSALTEELNNTTDPNELIALQQEASVLYDQKTFLETQWQKQYQGQTTSPETGAETTFQDAQFQSTENRAPLNKVNLEDIKKAFPNQEIIQNADGNVSIKFKNGQGLTIKSIQTADQGFVKLAIETGQMSKTGKIRGITIGTEILLDENFADNKTLWHENKHVLDNLGMITAADNSALNAEFNKLRKAGKLEFALSTHEDAKQRMVENRANMFAQIMVNREAYRKTAFGKTIQRIMDFFQQLLSFGKQTVSSLALEVESGKIYERQTTAPNPAKVAAAVGANKAITDMNKVGMTDPVEQTYRLAEHVIGNDLMIAGNGKIKANHPELAARKLTNAQEHAKQMMFADGPITEAAVLAQFNKAGMPLYPNFQAAQTFYSRLQSAVYNDFPAELKAQKVIPYMKSKLKNTNEQRPYQEIQAIGLQEWLAAKKPTDIVTKEELSNFVKANMVELEDVILGEAESISYDDAPQEVKDILDTIDEDGSLTYEEEEALKALGYETDSDMDGTTTSIYKIGTTPTQFSNYVEPGAVEGSYREMFVTAPEKDRGRTYDQIHGMLLDFDMYPVGSPERMALLKEQETAPDTEHEGWEDGHSQYGGIANPIVRIRFNEVNADGKRILRIEEMQGPSDLNQSKMPKHLKENIYQLGIKRILAYAKENGFDGVALVTKPGMTAGETQADRYSLEKQIESVNAKPLESNNFLLEVMNKSGNKVEGIPKKVTADALENYVGKELASKIIKKNGGFFTGLDLKVGGEGLKKLYDQQLPAMIESYGNGKMVESGRITNTEISEMNSLRDKSFDSSLTPREKDREKVLISKYNAKGWVPVYLPITSKTSDSFSMFQVTEQKISDTVYDQMFKERNTLIRTIGQTLRMRGDEIKHLIDKFGGSTYTRLLNINENIAMEYRNIDVRTAQAITKALEAAHPLLKKAQVMSKEDKFIWNEARKAADQVKVERLAEKYHMVEEWKAVRQVLDAIRADAIDVGFDVGYIEEYWPRKIKDVVGFLQATKAISNQPEFSNVLKKQAEKIGLNTEEFIQQHPEVAADMISNMILNPSFGIGGPGNIQARKYNIIPPELTKFYMDSDAALMSYIYNMTKKIEARRFFGKVPTRIAKLKSDRTRKTNRVKELQAIAERSKTVNPEEYAKVNSMIGDLSEDLIRIEQTLDEYKINDRDYTENIGAYVTEKMASKELNPDHEKTVKDILHARFNEHGTTGLVTAFKNASYIDVLGSPLAAITQIGDQAWAMYVAQVWTPRGFSSYVKHLKKATTGSFKESKYFSGVYKMFGGSEITKEDLGIERIAQEFADGTTLSNAVSTVFKLVGLEKMDSIGKETLINVARDRYKAMVKTEDGRIKLMQKLRPIFGTQSDSVIQDLLADNPSDNIKVLLYHRVLDFHPIALSAMPEPYLNGGNGRVAYMLKTYTIQQFDVFRREAWHDMKNGYKDGNKAQVIEGITNMIKLASLLTLANAGADELKDFMLGKETKFSDNVIENFLTLGGASRYIKMEISKDGLGSALSRQVLPPFKFLNSISKDAHETYKNYVSGDVSRFDHARIIDSIPIAGKLYYWHYGRGAENKQSIVAQEFKSASKDAALFKKQLENSQDKRLFIQSNLDRFKQAKLQENFQAALNRNKAVINKLEKIPSTENVQTRLGQLKAQREQILKRYQEVAETIQ